MNLYIINNFYCKIGLFIIFMLNTKKIAYITTGSYFFIIIINEYVKSSLN
jgi:hypothetical protein